MKKILTVLAINVIISGFLLLPSIQADTEGGHVDLDTVLPQLLEKYNVKDKEDLDCDVLTDEDFEVIGDAWMEARHPGEEHEVMDNMMGGEESETLRAAHIRMGENYLGCGNYQGLMGNEMMDNDVGMMQGRGVMNRRTTTNVGGGMMGGTGMMSGNSMMGSYFGVGQSTNLLDLILYLLFSVLLGALIRYFWIKGSEMRDEAK